MKKLGILSIALIVVSLVAVNSSFAITRTVCAFGCGYTSINSALAAAADGDIILVKPGVYNESVLVNKSVQILGGATGQNKLTTIVQAPSTGLADSYGFVVAASNVLISGFTIRGGTNAWGYGVCIGFSPAGSLWLVNNVRVRYCTVEKSTWGISVREGGSNIRLAYNQIRYMTAMAAVLNAGTGIYIRSNTGDITNVSISYNQINDNDLYGVLVTGQGGTASFNGMLIQYNTLVNNGSYDLLGPSNQNQFGFIFINASGTITMNYNNIKATTPSGAEIQILGPPYATFTGTGNLIFPNNRQSLAGPSSPLTLP